MIEHKVVKAIPSSFVAANMKLASESGSGEAKLWVGQLSNSAELDAFFEFDNGYSYKFTRGNLLEYLHQVKIEYIYQKFNNYKNASLLTWNENYSQIKELSDADFEIKLVKFTDKTRYYVRADELIFKKIFRKIVVPKLTNMAFVKNNESKEITLLLELNLEFEGGVESTVPFTPEWFREKAKDYPELDAEASEILSEFQETFSVENLSALSGRDLLHSIFLNNENANNVCRILEFDSKIKDMFGSIKGGSAYKYGLYYSTDGKWMAGTNRNPKELSEEEAIELGTEIRNYLVKGYKAILDYGELMSIDDYRNLYESLKNITNGYIDKAWFMKYYFMMFPDLFASDYSDAAQRIVLAAIGQEWEKYALVRMGQIKLYTDECHISNVMFNKIFWENYTDEVVEPKDEEVAVELCYETRCDGKGFARNRILFGAPGTGKSYTVNKEKNTLLQLGGTYERVTFHPDYTYANFVGTYKPVPCKDSEDKEAITYEYVPGPFMRTLVKALKNSQEGAENIKPHLLIIEEINRANVAAVFGDVFQLLDREENEVSEYPIQATEDMKKYLAKELKVPVSECEEIKIPDNMFIWATMNSADQGVFPMDTAFKRRWDFTYLGINSSEDGIAGKKVVLGTGEYKRIVEWNALRKAINKELLKYKVNEDKLMGPYFISKKNLGEDIIIDADKFIRIFKNKVLMYLFDDAAKQKRPSLFAGCEEKNLYSAICDEFDEKGVHIFCEDVYNQFIDIPEEG